VIKKKRDAVGGVHLDGAGKINEGIGATIQGRMNEEGDEKFKGVGIGEEFHERFSSGLDRGRIQGASEEREKVGVGGRRSKLAICRIMRCSGTQRSIVNLMPIIIKIL
jgi:hypothetical protein